MSVFFLGSWRMNRSAEQTNRQEPLRGSRDLFVPRYDSFPVNPEKKTLIPKLNTAFFIFYEIKYEFSCSVWYRACLSGTARGCLVQAVRHSLLFIYVSNYDVTTQSATIPATSEVPVTLKRTLLACFSLKCVSQRGTRKIIKSQCWIQTDKSQSRVIRCHIPVSATASTGICDIVSPSTEICQSGSNTGTWFY